jgi:8-oxo-dGTP pyrophosphatase MutT (NUDIX family)
MSLQIFQVAAKALIKNTANEILMVHIPAWSGNEAHWDLPGGRMDAGENLLETLKREMLEEIDNPYIGTPTQLMTFLTNITIPIGNTRVPLIFVVYQVMIAEDAVIKLDPNSAEDSFQWFNQKDAAEEMKYKFSQEFCELVSKL